MELEKITFFLSSLKIPKSHLNKMENWERKFLIQRAKELNIEGMEEFLNLKDYSKIEFPKKTKDKVKEEIGRGVIFTRLLLIGNFSKTNDI